MTSRTREDIDRELKEAERNRSAVTLTSEEFAAAQAAGRTHSEAVEEKRALLAHTHGLSLEEVEFVLGRRDGGNGSLERYQTLKGIRNIDQYTQFKAAERAREGSP